MRRAGTGNRDTWRYRSAVGRSPRPTLSHHDAPSRSAGPVPPGPWASLDSCRAMGKVISGDAVACCPHQSMPRSVGSPRKPAGAGVGAGAGSPTSQQVPEEKSVGGMVQVEMRLEMHPAPPPSQPQHVTRASARPTPAPSIQRVIQQQPVQHGRCPARHRPDPLSAEPRPHRLPQHAQQDFTHELMTPLMGTRAHVGDPDPRRAHIDPTPAAVRPVPTPPGRSGSVGAAMWCSPLDRWTMRVKSRSLSGSVWVG